MKTKIAIFTKAEYSKEMNDIVASLKADERFDVFEIEDGKNIPSDCKNLIVFGGDGTVLEAVKNIREDVVVTGVNTGNLGFLTQFEKNSSASEIANGILEGKIEQRAILDVRFDDFCVKALNEIVLKSATSRPIYIGVYVDGKFVDSYHSDGAIVSSPTGSTAYSLSAGGPVAEPTARNFIVSPICAHSIHANSYILSPERVISVQTEKNGYKPVLLSVDGGRAFSLRSGDCVEVRRSKYDTKLVRLGKRSFCEILQKKMLMGGNSDEE